MKKNLVSIITLSLLAFQFAFAQSAQHLKISDEHPQAGRPVTIIYDPSGTNLADKANIKGAVYFVENKKYPVNDLVFKRENGLYRATTTIPSEAQAFFVRMNAGEDVDNNGGAGYIYKVYQAGKPVPGAYAAEAFILTDRANLYYSKINKSADKALELYALELERYPQEVKEYQRYYIPMLVKSKDERIKAEGVQKLPLLINSDNENDQIAAVSVLRSLNKKVRADSLEKAMQKNFPKGITVRQNMVTEFWKEKDLDKQSKIYDEYVTLFPENVAENHNSYDGMRQQLMQGYLKTGNGEKAEYFEKQITEKSWAGAVLNAVAYEWAIKGERLTQDELLSKKALNIAREQLLHPVETNYTSLSQAKEYAQNNYDYYTDTYAYILAKQGKYAEALKYEQPVYANFKGTEVSINENYTMMLTGAGQYSKAQKVIEKSLKAGKSSPKLEDQLKEAYLKENGNSNGYDNYLASLKTDMKVKEFNDMIKEMVNQPSPKFALKDFEGKTVSLTDLKGKIVVIDFWATWCGPCKASFPGMQMAVNKYKDDPTVKFLFVDTWENGDDYMPNVKKFIADNKYTFNVLIDEKGEDGRQSKVVSQFKVDGIPTKFLIDQNGNIRFKKIGFSGSDDAVLNEVSAMIEVLKKPEVMKTAKTEE